MAPICTSPHVSQWRRPGAVTSKAPSRDRASVENSHRLLGVLSVGFSTHSTKNHVQPLRESSAHNRGTPSRRNPSLRPPTLPPVGATPLGVRLRDSRTALPLSA